MIVDNKLQNILVFDENIIECDFEDEKENKFEAVLSFNGEKCHIGVVHTTEGGLSEYNLLDDGKISHFNEEETYNCKTRMGTDHALQ